MEMAGMATTTTTAARELAGTAEIMIITATMAKLLRETIRGSQVPARRTEESRNSEALAGREQHLPASRAFSGQLEGSKTLLSKHIESTLMHVETCLSNEVFWSVGKWRHGWCVADNQLIDEVLIGKRSGDKERRGIDASISTGR
jgi:hypothetical protein